MINHSPSNLLPVFDDRITHNLIQYTVIVLLVHHDVFRKLYPNRAKKAENHIQVWPVSNLFCGGKTIDLRPLHNGSAAERWWLDVFEVKKYLIHGLYKISVML